MSSSSSIKRYQIPKLCKMDINIQWRYVECDYYGKGKNEWRSNRVCNYFLHDGLFTFTGGNLWKLDIICKFWPNNFTFSDLEWEHITCKVLKYFKKNWYFYIMMFLLFYINFVHPVINRLIQAKTSWVYTVSVDLFILK
jgi:hypothetical protein